MVTSVKSNEYRKRMRERDSHVRKLMHSLSMPPTLPLPSATMLSEYVELDIGSGVLWCKYCGRTHCPLFKTKGGKNTVLRQIEKNTEKSNGRVALDVYNPEYRYVLVLITLSHVGCQSFSNVDVPDKTPESIYSDENPDFLEILDDVYTEEVTT